MGSLEGTFDTRLHEAVRFSDIGQVRTALQQGYDPNLIGLYQWNALHEAAHNGETEIVRLLLDCKGDPNKRDFLRGCTPVHYAAQEGHTDCLQLLLNAGGRCDVVNNDGETVLDLAAPEFKGILGKQDNIIKVVPLSQAEDILSRDEECPPSDEISEDQSNLTRDTDSASSTVDSGICDSDAPALGYIHLSFEYHARKATLRVRVWQISDLLLPPPHTSMIGAVYVRAFLIPDKKKETKRKTEEVRVENSETHVHHNRKMSHPSIQHIFTPSSFKFTKPLEYTDISKEIIKEKSIQLDVCLSQKYTKRSFLVGMVTMPLKVAVKKLVKEKLPLIPCMNHTIPSSMRVYSASELQVTNSAKIFYSNPNVRSISLTSLVDANGRSTSEPELKSIITDRKMSSPSTYINVPIEVKTWTQETWTHNKPTSDNEKDTIHVESRLKPSDDKIPQKDGKIVVQADVHVPVIRMEADTYQPSIVVVKPKSRRHSRGDDGSVPVDIREEDLTENSGRRRFKSRNGADKKQNETKIFIPVHQEIVMEDDEKKLAKDDRQSRSRDIKVSIPGALPVEELDNVNIDDKNGNFRKKSFTTLDLSKEKERHPYRPNMIRVIKTLKPTSDVVPIMDKKQRKQKHVADTVRTEVSFRLDSKPTPVLRQYSVSENVESRGQGSSAPSERIIPIEDRRSDTSSRPGTPTWDYYDMTPRPVEIPLQSSKESGIASPCLPMETHMEIHGMGSSFKPPDPSESLTENVVKPKIRHHPGKAVPRIVITPPGEKKEDRNTVEQEHCTATWQTRTKMNVTEITSAGSRTMAGEMLGIPRPQRRRRRRSSPTTEVRGSGRTRHGRRASHEGISPVNTEPDSVVVELGDANELSEIAVDASEKPFIIDMESFGTTSGPSPLTVGNKKIRNFVQENRRCGEKSKSLSSKQVIPMQVFIDNSSDSCGDQDDLV